MVLLLLSLWMSSSQAAPATPIAGFSKVTDGIFRGARPTLTPVNSVQWLSQMGIRTDIDLQGGDLDNPYTRWYMSWHEPGENPQNIALEAESAASFGMHFLNAPLDSLDDVTNGENDLIDQVLSAMNDPRLQPVFIHCEHGKDRTGLLVALYRVKFQHWDIKTAHDEWVALGHTSLSQVFTGDLDEYYYAKAKQIQQRQSGE